MDLLSDSEDNTNTSSTNQSGNNANLISPTLRTECKTLNIYKQSSMEQQDEIGMLS